MTPQPDSKSQARKRPPSLVYVELSSVNGGMMRDIAEDSFALRAMIPVRVGDKTPFRFSLDEATRIEGEGLIDAIEEDGHVANIRMLQISAVAREQLLGWLTRPDTPRAAPVSPAPKPNSAPNSSLEELRNELHSVAPAKSSGEAPQQLPREQPRPETQTPPELPQEIQLEKPAQELPQEQPQETLHQTVREAAPPPFQEILSETPATSPRKWPLRPKITLPDKQSPGWSLRNPSMEFHAAPGSALRESAAELHQPAPLPPLDRRDLPPAMFASLQTPSSKLEPLPSFEDDSRSASLQWPSSFTLGRAIAILVLLSCIAASLAYHQQLGETLIWLGQQISDTPQSPPQPNGEPASFAPATQSPSAADALKRQNNSSSAPKSPQNENTPAAPTANSDSNSEISANKSVNVPPVTQSPGPAIARSPASPTLVPAIQQNRRQTSPAPAESASEPGQLEFEQAQRLLLAGRNSGVRAEIPEAVRLLWAAVEKGNVSAELALAELYRTGDGITKNCDQTRILLTAAARKGSPEAHRRLHDLLQHPCP